MKERRLRYIHLLCYVIHYKYASHFHKYHLIFMTANELTLAISLHVLAQGL